MIPAHIFDGAEDWCRDCDDIYCEEADPDEASCAERGHTRLFDPALIKWHICDRCHGEGTLRGYPGAYSAEEFAEAFGNDPDEYLNYRRDCEDCGGTGKVRGVDEVDVYGEGFGTTRFDEDIALIQWVNEYYDGEAISAQERRMGA